MFTLNPSINKPSKSEAFRLAADLMSGHELTATEREKLYKYFSPSLAAKPKTPEQWVAKAVGKKDVRYYLNYLYSDGEFLVGTDGHRLHYTKTELEPGFYDPRTLSKVIVDARFPDYKRVIPKRSPSEYFALDFDSLEHKSELVGKENDERPLNVSDFPGDGPRVQTEYLKQALNGFDSTVALDSASPATVSIHGKHEFGAFVIMPMRK